MDKPKKITRKKVLRRERRSDGRTTCMPSIPLWKLGKRLAMTLNQHYHIVIWSIRLKHFTKSQITKKYKYNIMSKRAKAGVDLRAPNPTKTKRSGPFAWSSRIQ